MSAMEKRKNLFIGENLERSEAFKRTRFGVWVWERQFFRFGLKIRNSGSFSTPFISNFYNVVRWYFTCLNNMED